MDHAADPVGTFHRPVLLRVNEFREQIPREHRLDEPDGASLRQFAEAQAWREALDLEPAFERGRSQMFAFRLRFQAKPKRLIQQRERG